MKIIRFPRFLSFKSKLILLFSLIITGSILFIGFFNYYETSIIIHKDIEKFSSKNLREVNLNLERYFNQYEQIFFNIASSSEFKNWLSAEKGDKIHTSLIYDSIKRYYINPITLFYPEIITIDLLNENGNVNTFYFNNKISYIKEYPLKYEAWVKNIELNNTHIISGKNDDYISPDNVKIDGLYTIKLARKYFFSDTAAGYIIIDVDMEPVTKILEEMKYTDSGDGMILNDEGVIMAHTDIERISGVYDQGIYNEKIRGRDSGYIFESENNRIIVFSTIKNIGWKAVAIIPYATIAEGLGKIWTITLAVIALSILLSVFLVIIISTSLTKRIKVLRASMRQIKNGEFGKRVSIRGNDEISELALSYNNMLENLEQYIHDLAETKLLQQEAVLSALQAQINSHFLYNTLEVINSMAYISRQKDIQTVVVSLAKMLRYTSNYKETLVTIKDEIGHLKDYLSIMEMQMGERLKYDIEMEDGVEDVLCLKAIIQPIVENSIKHGIELVDAPGHINIKVGFRGVHVYISISDNGKGFSQEKLFEMKSKLEILESGNHIREISRIGLVNVNYRLKVFYNNDPETGLVAENIWKRNGAQIQITFPIARKGEV